MVDYGLMALGGISLLQTGLLWRVSRRLGREARINERLSHFAEALALLTDTTEAGLSNVAAQLDSSSARRAPRAVSRAATSKRIVTAARRGRSIGEIARSEAVSESEIRLHLEMADPDAEEGVAHGSMRI